MYLSVAHFGGCVFNAPGLPPFPASATGQYIFQVNDACTAATWYSKLSEGWYYAILATDPVTGDIFGTVREKRGEVSGAL